MLLRLCCCFGLLLLSVVYGQISIDQSDPVTNGISVRPLLPIQGRPCEIAVTLCNSDMQHAHEVSVSLSLVPGAKSQKVPANGSLPFVFQWTPQKNGYQPVVVNAVFAGKTHTVSALIPVVSRPLYFPWFGGHTPEARSLRFANIVLSGSDENHAYWRSRGALPCLWKGVDLQASAEKYAGQLAEGLGDPAAGPAGIMIDEMGGYAPEEILKADFFNGLKLFLERYPQHFTALWVCGSLHWPYCNITRNVYRKDKGISLLMLECYSNFQVVELRSQRRFAYYDQRIDMARQQDVITNSVMTLGIDGHQDKFNLTAYEIEDEVRYIRRHAPEMPGVGFFHFETKSPELIPVADELCRRYFIEPLLQVWPEDLQFSRRDVKAGEIIDVYAGVYNLGGMDADNIETRLFVDGKLLKKETLHLPALTETGAPRAVQLKAAWKAKKGYHTFRVEIHPKGKETVLDGIAEQTIRVKP